ncbi:hypothetical protein POVCU2_0047920 [Plasmodium ovale curtisi]|uniref:Uncharacterized protein n=1 Tax=Plasmodium ovale curtisi TaxID=864141 RepID=A0A1A8WZ16_PLAOA|nr:hypothetical protein POVCU2_0047920 [Plasmodium ovale curtisi]SBS98214.1 hypothetical protein POVCU1_044410 [Plasmodium ovale curtisi]
MCRNVTIVTVLNLKREEDKPTSRRGSVIPCTQLELPFIYQNREAKDGEALPRVIRPEMIRMSYEETNWGKEPGKFNVLQKSAEDLQLGQSCIIYTNASVYTSIHTQVNIYTIHI